MKKHPYSPTCECPRCFREGKRRDAQRFGARPASWDMKPDANPFHAPAYDAQYSRGLNSELVQS